MNRPMAARRAKTWVAACVTLAGLLSGLGAAAVTAPPSGGGDVHALTSLATPSTTQSIRWQ